MIRREGKGPASSDLLVCFPRRAHLTLMPKPAAGCSPRQNLQRHYQNHLKKSMRGGRNLSIGGGHASPYTLSSGTKSQMMSSDDNSSEPTSPKVTCAGQIKVRPASTKSCKNWQSVMEEIERLHNNNNKKKSTSWVETLGFKKEVMHFLSCLRKIKFDFHCVGAFSHVDISSDDDEDDDIEINQDQGKNHHDDDDHHDNVDGEEVSSRTVFSKWFMVLQENQNSCDVYEKDQDQEKVGLKSSKETEDDQLPSCPPPNALLLMRCRSAPAKSWMEEKLEEEEEEEKDDQEEEEDADKENDQLEKKEISKRKSLMELMQNDQSDLIHKLSSCDNIAKETWVINGGIHKDPFSRSRSWKR